jgi:AcrR family transcriptional regulator
MPKVTKAHLKAREEQILFAAHKCFSQKGFHATTMREICRAARLSPGAVYGYFKSKEAIVEALAGLGRQSTIDYLRAATEAERADVAVIQILASLRECYETPMGRQSAQLDVRLWGEAIHTPRLRKLFQMGFDNGCGFFSELVRKGQKKGQIRKEIDAGRAAWVLMAMVAGMALMKAVLPRTDLKQVTDAIGDVLLRGLSTTPTR